MGCQFIAGLTYRDKQPFPHYKWCMFWCCVLSLFIVCIVMINVLFTRLHYEQSWNLFFMKIRKLSPMPMSHDTMWSLFSCHPPNFHASALIALLKVQIKFYFSITSDYFSVQDYLLPSAHALFHESCFERFERFKIQDSISHSLINARK